jgi:hypothetical protein
MLRIGGWLLLKVGIFSWLLRPPGLQALRCGSVHVEAPWLRKWAVAGVVLDCHGEPWQHVRHQRLGRVRVP